MEDDGAMLIADALSYSNNNLERLSIKYNNIRSEGLCAIIDSLRTNKTITHLYIWGNHLEEPACIVIFFYFNRISF